eukprot:15428675-Alexandrium_andersonii.AAC.1
MAELLDAWLACGVCLARYSDCLPTGDANHHLSSLRHLHVQDPGFSAGLCPLPPHPAGFGGSPLSSQQGLGPGS